MGPWPRAAQRSCPPPGRHRPGDPVHPAATEDAMTGIEWTGKTWNPATGCDRVSPGCDHCYALRDAARLKRMGQAKYQADGDPRTSGPGFGVTIHPETLTIPLGWRKP